MQKLGQRYKLVPLSNISFAAFDKTMRGPLKDVKWDATCIAEAIGSYKPDHHNFQYLLDTVQEKLGIEKNELVHIAHGVSTDQIPAEEMGIDHVWIRRGLDAATTEGVQRGQLSYETLGDLADDLVQ
jgi:FMN phosphatase YigB (HAD superfamily)